MPPDPRSRHCRRYPGDCPSRCSTCPWRTRVWDGGGCLPRPPRIPPFLFPRSNRHRHRHRTRLPAHRQLRCAKHHVERWRLWPCWALRILQRGNRPPQRSPQRGHAASTRDTIVSLEFSDRFMGSLLKSADAAATFTLSFVRSLLSAVRCFTCPASRVLKAVS